jgi:hypothetical protein
MPLMQLEFPARRISGRSVNAGIVHTYNRGQALIRSFTPPAQPDTPDQQAIRTAFSVVTKQWKLLSQANRDGWHAWAAANPITNRLTNQVTRNGISAYTQLATLQYIRTGTLLSLAPVLSRPAPITGANSFMIDGTDITVILEHSHTTLTGLYVLTRVSPPTAFESQYPNASEYRLVRGVDSLSFTPLLASGSSYTISDPKYLPADTNFAGLETSIVNTEGYESVTLRLFPQWFSI